MAILAKSDTSKNLLPDEAKLSRCNAAWLGCVRYNNNMIRKAEYKDMDAILSLAKDFVTSFVIEENAFRASFTALMLIRVLI